MLGDYLQMKKEERDLYRPKDKQLRSVGDALIEYNPNDGTTRTIAEAPPKKEKGSYSLRQFGNQVHRINNRTGETELVKTVEKEEQTPTPHFTHVTLADGRIAIVNSRDGSITPTEHTSYVKKTNPWRTVVKKNNDGRFFTVRYNIETDEQSVKEIDEMAGQSLFDNQPEGGYEDDIFDKILNTLGGIVSGYTESANAENEGEPSSPPEKGRTNADYLNNKWAKNKRQ